MSVISDLLYQKCDAPTYSSVSATDQDIIVTLCQRVKQSSPTVPAACPAADRLHPQAFRARKGKDLLRRPPARRHVRDAPDNSVLREALDCLLQLCRPLTQ